MIDGGAEVVYDFGGWIFEEKTREELKCFEILKKVFRRTQLGKIDIAKLAVSSSVLSATRPGVSL